ncbi:hypothetical protein JCM11491_004287 [Sporobolomyces phaffii]
MAGFDHATVHPDALTPAPNGDRDPTPRRLSTTSPPRPEPLDLPPEPSPPTHAGHSTGDHVESAWREPEAGFEAISLDDGRDMSPSRRGSDGSIASKCTTHRTVTPPVSEVASTAPTTHAPCSPAGSSSNNLPSHSSPTRDAAHDRQSASPGGGGGMSKPPDSTKVEQPSPAKQAQNAQRPSVMQKIISMTRQRDLPPKDRDEEEKHLKQLADMFAASKEAEKRRRSEADTRAAARASALASALPTWESAILPNWRAVLHDTSEGRHLRRLWWQGTMPVRFRGRLWSLCIGNGLAISKNAYAAALARAKTGLEQGREDLVRFKEEAEEDMENVLPTLKLFQKRGGVMHEDLVDLLLAWSVHDQSTPRYPRGLAYPASLLLVNMPPSEAFVSLLNLISKSFLKAFYASNPASLESYERVFDTLLADAMPKVYANFSSSVVRPGVYLVPWLTTLFVGFVPLELATRLFDVFLLEGDSFCFRVGLVLLEILEPRLFNPNLGELEAVFRGRDQGAVAIVKREKGLLTVGGAGSTAATRHQGDGREEAEDGVEVEEVYTEMGCTEDRVFELLEKLEWKEETWDRLVERELPDAD